MIPKSETVDKRIRWFTVLKAADSSSRIRTFLGVFSCLLKSFSSGQQDGFCGVSAFEPRLVVVN